MGFNFNPEKNSEDEQLRFPWDNIQILWNNPSNTPPPSIDSHVDRSEDPTLWNKEWEDLEDDAQN